MRAAMTTLMCEVDTLAHERHAALYGAAKEGAALAALRLLRAVLERDLELVAALRGATLTGGCREQWGGLGRVGGGPRGEGAGGGAGQLGPEHGMVLRGGLH